jgi:tetratricopeptide (TPR) repeat protein
VPPIRRSITYLPLLEIFRQAGAEDELADALAAGGPEDTFWSGSKARERRARDRPVALIVEDVHWAEQTLLDLLEHLVEWARDAPLLLLCAARPDLLDVRPTWGGSSSAENLTLEPLSAAESQELIEELVDGGRLATTVRARINEVADGNPLFVEQLLAMILEGGDPADVPPTIQALLAARLDSLPAEEREILERASVVGLEFEWDALGAMAADGARPGGAHLSALVRKEFVSPHEVIEDAFRFRHMLIRDAAYDRIAKERRSRLHEAFARWLDGRGEEFDEVVGYHLEQAYHSLAALGQPGERGRALAEEAAARLVASGSRADARADARAAVNLLERATSLLQPDDPRRLALLPKLGRALRDQGHLDRADEVLTEAVERAAAADEAAVSADALVARADLRFHRPAQTGVGRQDVLDAIAAAIPVFEEMDDAGALARALVLRGKLRFWGGEAEAALPDLARGGEVARAAGIRNTEAESIQFACAAMRVGPTPVPEALRRLDEIGSRTVRNARLEEAILLARAELVAAQGRFDVARALAAEALRLAEDHGLDSSHAHQVLGNAAMLAGDPATGEREYRIACDHYEAVGELSFLASAAVRLAEVVYQQGRYDEVLALTDRWRPELLTDPGDADAHAGWRRMRANALARVGELAEAERLAREAVAIASASDVLDLRAETLADLGEVLHLAGRVEESRTAVEEAIALYDEKGNLVQAGRLRSLLAAPQVEA